MTRYLMMLAVIAVALAATMGALRDAEAQEWVAVAASHAIPNGDGRRGEIAPRWITWATGAGDSKAAAEADALRNCEADLNYTSSKSWMCESTQVLGFSEGCAAVAISDTECGDERCRTRGYGVQISDTREKAIVGAMEICESEPASEGACSVATRTRQRPGVDPNFLGGGDPGVICVGTDDATEWGVVYSDYHGSTWAFESASTRMEAAYNAWRRVGSPDSSGYNIKVFADACVALAVGVYSDGSGVPIRYPEVGSTEEEAMAGAMRRCNDSRGGCRPAETFCLGPARGGE